MEPKTSTIEFLIVDIGTSALMKPIPLTTLASFHGLTSEDTNKFLIEQDIIFWGYDYITDAKKLKISLVTLKAATLRLFMGLGGKTITTLDEMRTSFLEKYQDYCKSRDIKEEIFKFMQKEDENMEDFVEEFKYTLQRSSHSSLDKDILIIILLRAFREDSLELLNVVGKGDISNDNFNTICVLCIQCSRGVARNKQGI